MKLWFVSLLFVLALALGTTPANAQSNLIGTGTGIGHGNLITFTLPAVPATGCVRYYFDVNLGGGGFTNTLSVVLNTTTAESISPTYGDHVFLKGLICNNGSQTSQWGSYEPVAFDTTLLTPAGGSISEDFSLTTNTLTFNASVQRGFGVTVVGMAELVQP